MATISPAAGARRPRLRDTVAAEVRALRGRYSLSQSDLAGILGITQSQVSKRLRGDLPFSLDEIEILAEAFGIDSASLMSPRENAPEMTAPSIALIRKEGGVMNACSRRTTPILTVVPRPRSDIVAGQWAS